MSESQSAVPALELQGLCCGYGRTRVVRDVSLRVAPSSVTALLGPNGAGKSTLLKAISGFVRVFAGGVLISGTDVTSMAPVKRTKLGLCHVPERRGIFRTLSVRENLVMQARKGDRDTAIARAVDAFPRLGERLTQQAGTLSGGEQQMLSMVRAYVRDPSLILVDEASLGLAPLVVDDVFAFLERVKERGGALLLVDQFVTRALEIADYAHILSNGRITVSGTAAELRSRDLFMDYVTAGEGIAAGQSPSRTEEAGRGRL
jgi:branched-chain amino acid transport system ATP-binding protein